MTKEEFLKALTSYDEARKFALDAATAWMLAYQGEGNTYGYKVGNLYIEGNFVKFKFYHHDGVIPMTWHSVPIDFIWNRKDLESHAINAKKAYSESVRKDIAIEQQIRELKSQLSYAEVQTVGAWLPTFHEKGMYL